MYELDSSSSEDDVPLVGLRELPSSRGTEGKEGRQITGANFADSVAGGRRQTRSSVKTGGGGDGNGQAVPIEVISSDDDDDNVPLRRSPATGRPIHEY